MNALYYVSGYDPKNNGYWRFAVTVPGTATRQDAENKVYESYPELRHFNVKFLCTTTDEVFTEV